MLRTMVIVCPAVIVAGVVKVSALADCVVS